MAVMVAILVVVGQRTATVGLTSVSLAAAGARADGMTTRHMFIASLAKQAEGPGLAPGVKFPGMVAIIDGIVARMRGVRVDACHNYCHDVYLHAYHHRGITSVPNLSRFDGLSLH